MLLITKRRKIGTICGHTIYAITKSEMVPIPHATVRSKMAYSKDENRSLVNFACNCNVSMVHLKRHVDSSIDSYTLSVVLRCYELQFFNLSSLYCAVKTFC